MRRLTDTAGLLVGTEGEGCAGSIGEGMKSIKKV
jgi:hypothetical protein